MYYANDKDGDRVFIDDAQKGQNYTCPACGDKLIIKRGYVVAHHFAHKAHKNCDPWYKDRMSAWHRKLQSMFPPECQEVVLWNEDHSEFHVADVFYMRKGIGNVVEIQHSPISRKEFILRSDFYLSLGYKLIWIFDFCECDQEKRILYTEKDTTNHRMRIVWPGKDRVRFLDYLDRAEYANPGYFHIIFHIKTGLGEEFEHDSYNGYSWTTWEYVSPFEREYCFIQPRNPYIECLDEFEAYYYGEEEFYDDISHTSFLITQEKQSKENNTQNSKS